MIEERNVKEEECSINLEKQLTNQQLEKKENVC